MAIVGYILIALLAYLLGSIPTGFLVGKSRGIDIRQVGSGNIGATNAFRALGTPAGVFVLLMDALKGWLAVAVLAELVLVRCLPGASPLEREWARIVAGVTAILGHNFTCWLHFRGGKGIATSAGVLTALVPAALAIILGVWVIVFGLTRFVSLGSICASFVLPFATWFTTAHDLTLTAITGALAGLAIYKHKSNMRRLLAGTENRIGGKKSATERVPEKKT